MTRWMKRLLTLLLTMSLLLPSFGAALAEEEEEDLILFSSEDFVFEDLEDPGIPADEDEDEDEDEDLFIDDEIADELQEMDQDIDDTVDPNSLDLNPNLPEHVVNILLIGIDTRSRDMDEGLQHNDVNIVASINTRDGTIKLTSILRDTYLTIPGLKSKNRINVAYATKNRGAQRAMRTVNRNFELNIQYYVAINFFGLASIIDAIGGVDIEMSAKEARAVNAYLKAHPPAYDNSTEKRIDLDRAGGLLHCDGVQAVMYARLRSLDNDFARTARQRKLMEILLNTVLADGMDLNRLMSLLQECIQYARTNMPAMTMLNLGMQVLSSGILEKVRNGETLLEQHRIPMDKTYSYRTINGNSVVYMGSNNFPKNVKALHEFIYGEYIPAK